MVCLSVSGVISEKYWVLRCLRYILNLFSSSWELRATCTSRQPSLYTALIWVDSLDCCCPAWVECGGEGREQIERAKQILCIRSNCLFQLIILEKQKLVQPAFLHIK